MSNPIKKRYDFVLLFDVQDGNPNGDPDAGNMPRIDAETGEGLVTDVCIKRKIRNFIQLTQTEARDGKFLAKAGYDIYIKEKSVLARSHHTAFTDLGIDLGQESKKEIPEEFKQSIEDFEMPDGMSMMEDEDKLYLIIACDADIKHIKEYLKEISLEPKLKKFLELVVKDAKARAPNSGETEKGRQWMCSHFYDVRTFGAVMSLKSAPNCGQVRGPVQLTFARSIDPVVALEHSITRMAVATEKESANQLGANQTMGRKYTIPYGLYRAHGFISAHLANQTGFSEEDLELFWKAIEQMFEHDHSAARGLMSTRALIIFEHQDALGNAPAHSLFDRVKVKLKDETKPARKYKDYELSIDKSEIPDTVKVNDRVNCFCE